MDTILFLIKRTDPPQNLRRPGYSRPTYVLVRSVNRVFATRYAAPSLGGDPDKYEVSPLTEPGEVVWIEGALA